MNNQNRLDNVKSMLISKTQKILLELSQQIHKLSEKVDLLDERTKNYPSLYNNVDRLVQEILENRQERTLLFNRLENHEHRIKNLELI